jgi:hypothetical protein
MIHTITNYIKVGTAIADTSSTGAKARRSRSFSDVTWTTASFPTGIDAVFFWGFGMVFPARIARPSVKEASAIP